MVILKRLPTLDFRSVLVTGREQQSLRSLNMLTLHLIGAGFVGIIMASTRGRSPTTNASELKRTSTITLIVAWLVVTGLTALSWCHA